MYLKAQDQDHYYIIYVDDFCCQGAILFVDDTSLLISDTVITSMVAKANEKIKDTHEWLTDNGVVLNFNFNMLLFVSIE